VTIPVSGHCLLNILVKISITKSATLANRSEMLSFSQGANRLPRVIFDSEIDRSGSSLAVAQALDPPPPGQQGLLFLRFAFSAPISGAALPRPARSAPSNNRHFYSGRRRFHRRPPFIRTAKRVSRATRGGIGGTCGRPAAESLGRAGVCSPPARPRLSRFTRPYPWPPPPTRPRNERRSEVRPVFH
jgi:hypothetical protein